MNVRVLGAHNMESRATRPMSILVEGVLALDAGGLAGGLTLEEQQRVTAVLLTHRHYDHIKDVPLLALATYEVDATYRVYGIEDTITHLDRYLLDGALYPRFTQRPSAEHPKVRLCPVTPLVPFEVEEFRVVAVPMPHGVPAVGYQVTAPDGASLFYTGDTGGGLAEVWGHLHPGAIIVEVTLPNRYEARAQEAGHLTPALLARELEGVKRLGRSIPSVYAAHLNPWHEEELRRELASAAAALGTPITVVSEGMAIQVGQEAGELSEQEAPRARDQGR